MDPSFADKITVSTKNDVYSFGITLLVTVGSIRRCRYPSIEDAYADGPLDGWVSS